MHIRGMVQTWPHAAAAQNLLARPAPTTCSDPPNGSAWRPPCGFGRPARSDGAASNAAVDSDFMSRRPCSDALSSARRGGESVRALARARAAARLLCSRMPWTPGGIACQQGPPGRVLSYGRAAHGCARHMLCDRNALSAEGALAHVRPAVAPWSCCPRTGCAAENGCTRPSRACRSRADQSLA